MSEKILVVDDEPRVVRLVSEVLKAVGYQVIAAASGKSAIEMVALEQPDLVLLDILLPRGPDGYEVCRRIREFSEVPVIMLTAKAQETDMLQGFDVGADDYLTKPFSAKELVARVQAVLRRAQRPEEMITTPFTCGELEINFARRAIKVRGEQYRSPAPSTRSCASWLSTPTGSCCTETCWQRCGGRNIWMTLTICVPTSATCGASWKRIPRIPSISLPHQGSATC